MVKSSSMGLETSRLTHHRYASLPGGTLDNAALGTQVTHLRQYCCIVACLAVIIATDLDTCLLF